MFGMRRYLGWALIAFIVFYVISSPEGAAGFVRGALGGLAGAGQSLSTFVNALA